MTHHLSLDELGDVDTAQHDPHVMVCAQCRQVVSEQRAVRTLLAGLPEPGSAPPAVLSSIHAALRAEAADPVPAGTGATIRPLREATNLRVGRRPARYAHRGRGPQLLAAAAAAVVVVGVGALAGQRLTSADSGSAASAAGASSEMATRSGGSPASTAATPLLATGTAYTQGRLAGQVDALLARATSATSSGNGATSLPPQPATGTLSRPATGPLSRPGALDGCLQALGTTAAPLAVDVATYERKPAAVVVLPAAGGGREVWVVEPTCRIGADGTLYYARLP